LNDTTTILLITNQLSVSSNCKIIGYMLSKILILHCFKIEQASSSDGSVIPGQENVGFMKMKEEPSNINPSSR